MGRDWRLEMEALEFYRGSVLFPLKFLSVLKCVGRLRRGEEVMVTEVCPQRSDPSRSGV